MDNKVTLTRYLLAQQPDTATGDFTLLMNSIQLACKVIESQVRRAGMLGLYGMQGAVNVQGEDVKKLDTISNDTFVSALQSCGRSSVLVSEEVDEAIIVGNGKYCLAFDPLDGSSNIDVNGSIGSIFAIYEREGSGAPKVSDILLPGSKLIAAGYCMYGASTQLVFSCGNGVQMFTLDPLVGEFVLCVENAKIPSNSQTIYSINEGNAQFWAPEITKFVNHVKFDLAKPYSARYVGSMVADIHRTLIYGGVFLYPGDKKSPNGKLRLLYEVNPMSFLIEQAGGQSVSIAMDNSIHRCLDIMPKTIHERRPVVMGCKRDIEMLLQFYKA